MSVIPSSKTSSADSLSQAMSQVILKALGIIGLKKQNRDLVDMAENKEKARKTLEDKCKELVEKNNKLTKQVSGQASLQGEKHLIWDVMIKEATKIWPYLDCIQDKYITTQEARKNVQMEKKKLNKRPMDTTNNAISFLKKLTEEDIRQAYIQDRVLVITWERKVVNKHHHLETVEVKVKFMHNQVK